MFTETAMQTFWKKTAILLVILFIASVLAFTPTEQTEAASTKQVWAFYMGFWGGSQTWDWQASVLSDYPLLGKYDSRNPGVAGTQIDQAKGAGIDAFVVSWFGLEDQLTTTPVLNNMLDRAAERGFKIGAVLDIFDSDFNRNRDQLVNSLNYLVGNRANHSAYLRYNGKPVIMFAFQGNAGFSTAEWIAIRNQVDPNRNTIWLAEGVDGCCLYGGAMDGMYAFNIAWADGSAARYAREQNAVASRGGSLYVPTVHPGWNENLIAARDHRPNPTSPRDRLGGQFLRNMWNGAMTINPSVVLVVSWNEFMENSHIEPSQQYGTQSLDTLRPLISAWKSQAPAPPAGAPTGTTLQATTTLNVRSGPATSYSAIGTISPGISYAVTGSQNGWYSIAFNGVTGWVSGAYVTLSGTAPASPPPSSPAPPSAPAPAPTGQSLTSTVTLNVRSGPSTSYSAIGTISPGTYYAVTGSQNGWYSIAFNGATGWVSGAYVTLSGSAPSNPPAANPVPPASSPTGATLRSTVTLNVRSGPATTYSAIGTIYPGQTWPVTGSQNGWYAIAFNGQTGWVSGAYVTLTGTAPASPPTSAPTPVPPSGAPTGQSLTSTVNLNVRSGPATSYSAIGTISPGTYYAITGSQNGWYSISYNGQTGWVSGAFVTVSGNAPSAPAAPSGNAPVITQFCSLPSDGGNTYRLQYQVMNATRVEIYGNVMPSPTSGVFAVFGHEGTHWWTLDAFNAYGEAHQSIEVNSNNLGSSRCP